MKCNSFSGNRAIGSVFALTFVGAVVITAIAPHSLGAQGGIDPRCPGVALSDRAAQDACQKAIDIFAFMTPQLGIGLVGGNATLGTGGALGGIGRFSIGIRGNGIRGRVPQVGDVDAAVTGAVRSDYGIDNQMVGLPTVEGALGLFGGVPLGVTRALALDALLSATYVPELSRSNVAVSLPDGSLKVGFGGRLGVLTESFATPSVSLTYLKRDLPTASIVASSGDDRIAVENIAVKTTAWRAVAGKSVGFFGLAVGGGQDEYDSRASGSVQVREGALTINGGPYNMSQSVKRTNIFADASLNFPFVKFAVEIGRVSGGTIDTYNTFSGKRADDALTYASVGLRVGN